MGVPKGRRGPSLIELLEKYQTQDECLTLLEQLRWPDGVTCPRCESTHISRVKSRRQYQCTDCRYMFSATAGTILHKSRIPLRKWLLAIGLIVQAKKGLSALQLHRALGVNYKTALYLYRRIRAAMAENGFVARLAGIVEADETWIGGKGRNAKLNYKKRRTCVVGVRERGGELRAKALPAGLTAMGLRDFVRENVDPNAEMLCTDGALYYRLLRAEGYHPEQVDHQSKQYVRHLDCGDVHTGSIDSCWGLLKRGIVGQFHNISRQWTQSYVDEFTDRFNHTCGTNGNGYWKAVLGRALGKKPLLLRSRLR